MRNLPPAVRQKIAIMLKEKSQGLNSSPSPNLAPPPVQNGMKLPELVNPMKASSITQQGQKMLMPRFSGLKKKLGKVY